MEEKKKTNELKEYVFANPINFLFITFFYMLASLLFPVEKIALVFTNSSYFLWLFEIIIRFAFSVLPFVFYFFATRTVLELKNIKLNYIVILVIALLCINNIPFISILSEYLEFSFDKKIFFLHIFECISISVFEELIFRGLILILIFKILEQKKHKILLSILYSSSIFGLIHLINIFSGASVVDAIFQAFYTTAIGGLFAISYLVSKNIIVPIILHFIYNFGGLLYENNLVFGTVWSVEQLTVTITLGIITGIVCVYSIYILNKINNP